MNKKSSVAFLLTLAIAAAPMVLVATLETLKKTLGPAFPAEQYARRPEQTLNALYATATQKLKEIELQWKRNLRKQAGATTLDHKKLRAERARLNSEERKWKRVKSSIERLRPILK